MDRIFEAIEEWMRNLLTGMVSSNLTTMYTDVNEKTGQIAAQVGQTPQGWNGSIYSMIQNLSESVIVPIAGMIITFVLCYELISMLTEKNNMHDIDTWMFFKYFFKMWVAVWIVSHTFTITMAVFDVGQSVVSRAAGVISSDTAINIDTMISTMETAMESMEIGELVILALLPVLRIRHPLAIIIFARLFFRLQAVNPVINRIYKIRIILTKAEAFKKRIETEKFAPCSAAICSIYRTIKKRYHC